MYENEEEVDGGRQEITLLLKLEKHGPQYSLLLLKADEYELDGGDPLQRSVGNVRSLYDDYEHYIQNFSKISWLVDLERKTAEFGKGVFLTQPQPGHQVVAMYRGHLVDADGAVVVSCPHTEALFKKHPEVQRRFSRSHGLRVKRMNINHIIDGSHHTCSKFDKERDRGGLPWAACLNSSVTKGKANCKCVWCPSPHLARHRSGLNKNDNDMVCFIVTLYPLPAGAELLHCYSVAQAHRDFDLPPTPSPKRVKRKLSLLAVPEAAAFRCEGCQCSTPCSSTANCLTPQLNLSKRVKKEISLPVAPVASQAAAFRCEGCRCSTPCSSTANCLTPQLNLSKRGRIGFRFFR
jgi:uncharacterized C2H2 Zn-finger protein